MTHPSIETFLLNSIHTLIGSLTLLTISSLLSLMRPIIALCVLYRVHSRLAHLSPDENDSIIIIVVRRIHTWKRTMIAVVTVSVTVAKPGYNVRGVENKKYKNKKRRTYV